MGWSVVGGTEHGRVGERRREQCVAGNVTRKLEVAVCEGAFWVIAGDQGGLHLWAKPGAPNNGRKGLGVDVCCYPEAAHASPTGIRCSKGGWCSWD
jgi:hypothetical protein